MNSTEREIYDKYAYNKTFKYIWHVYSEFERRVNSTDNEYEGLKKGECRFDYSSWEKRLDLSHWQMNKAIKTLIKDECIEQRLKGKKGTQSTYFLTRFNLEFDQQKKQQNYKQKEQQKKSSNFNGLEAIDQQKEQQNYKQETVQSSIYNNLNIVSNNIYSSLENELDTKEIEKDLINKINSKYSKDLIKEELEKLKDKDISKLDLLKELDKNLKSKSKDNSNQDISTIFDYWNSKGIIKHKELKEDTKKAIKKAIKNYSIDEIKKAIDTYSEILKSEYYFTYKWNLKDFLNRNNAISTFMEDGSNKANYEEWKNKNKPKEEPKLKNNTSNFDY
ncbi:hypothetical protein [Clostridium perfringens]|uniref:hypothetical protein n=1 Tax=Clostridium perfringens TaxID=1502 RepID=UPI002340059A|nr:hypothetical protein [Clostridium perfringens]MDC4246027.1 hypothetical protein [Clostridium perfringens]